MKSSERLIERLKRECGLTFPDDIAIQRTYAGRCQKNNGAWLWCFKSKKDPMVCNMGSCERIVDLIKAPILVIERLESGAEIFGEKKGDTPCQSK